MRITKPSCCWILIGCGKRKAATAQPAADLYTGSLFRKRRAYAEKFGQRWFVLSARHGLVPPNVIIKPYDLTLSQLCQLDRMAWAVGVVQSLLSEMTGDFVSDSFSIELHAGEDYSEPLRQLLPAVGIQYDWPVRGMSQGDQMRWYTQAIERGFVLK